MAQSAQTGALSASFSKWWREWWEQHEKTYKTRADFRPCISRRMYSRQLALNGMNMSAKCVVIGVAGLLSENEKEFRSQHAATSRGRQLQMARPKPKAKRGRGLRNANTYQLDAALHPRTLKREQGGWQGRRRGARERSTCT